MSEGSLCSRRLTGGAHFLLPPPSVDSARVRTLGTVSVQRRSRGSKCCCNRLDKPYREPPRWTDGRTAVMPTDSRREDEATLERITNSGSRNTKHTHIQSYLLSIYTFIYCSIKYHHVLECLFPSQEILLRLPSHEPGGGSIRQDKNRARPRTVVPTETTGRF